MRFFIFFFLAALVFQLGVVNAEEAHENVSGESHADSTGSEPTTVAATTSGTHSTEKTDSNSEKSGTTVKGSTTTPAFPHTGSAGASGTSGTAAEGHISSEGQSMSEGEITTAINASPGPFNHISICIVTLAVALKLF
ncbi:hypothetical protein L596_004483 [Steinernema carpocapsae]|uniref:Uncharacterized protein n=1 Tax=Steinernema carpocapsae TaxID=34508 RepID=A0A4U8UVY5_STECR|nr:hypothetical protein L596_004483 [Steinernema carpocapsae]